MRRIVLLSLVAAALPLAIASAQGTGSLQVAVTKALQPSVLRGVPSELKDVRASVNGGVVTLTGSVGTYSSKLDAEVSVSRVAGVRAIRDNLRVAGPAVSDVDLRRTLEGRVRDRAISVQVHGGVATLTSRRIDPRVASTAFLLAAETPGVQGVVNEMIVDRVAATEDRVPFYTISSLP